MKRITFIGLKPGDKVTVKRDLVFDFYNGVIFIEGMIPLLGQTYTVKEFNSNGIYVEENQYLLSPGMIEEKYFKRNFKYGR